MLFQRYEAGLQLFSIKLKIQMEADEVIRSTPVAVGIGAGCWCVSSANLVAIALTGLASCVVWTAADRTVRSRHKFFDFSTR